MSSIRVGDQVTFIRRRDGRSGQVFRVQAIDGHLARVVDLGDWQRVGMRAHVQLAWLDELRTLPKVYEWDGTPVPALDATGLLRIAEARRNLNMPMEPHSLPRGLFLLPDGTWQEMTLRDYWRDHAGSR